MLRSISVSCCVSLHSAIPKIPHVFFTLRHNNFLKNFSLRLVSIFFVFHAIISINLNWMLFCGLKFSLLLYLVFLLDVVGLFQCLAGALFFVNHVMRTRAEGLFILLWPCVCLPCVWCKSRIRIQDMEKKMVQDGPEKKKKVSFT